MGKVLQMLRKQSASLAHFFPGMTNICGLVMMRKNGKTHCTWIDWVNTQNRPDMS